MDGVNIWFRGLPIEEGHSNTEGRRLASLTYIPISNWVTKGYSVLLKYLNTGIEGGLANDPPEDAWRLPMHSSEDGPGWGGVKAIRALLVSLTHLITSFPEERLFSDQG